MTVFSVQRFLEDHFERRGLADVDGYAVRAANVFERLGVRASHESLARQLARVRTAFFRRNPELDRREFEDALATMLERRFEKKKTDIVVVEFERGLIPVRRRLEARRRSIAALLSEFKRTIESRAIDAFWDSRKKGQLRRQPERIAQALLATFAKGVVGSSGLVLREIASGVGFVDVGVSFGGTLHLVELKILKGQLVGATQLATYMRTEGRNVGWLVLIDARPNARRVRLPSSVKVAQGLIKICDVDINPVAPHSIIGHKRSA